VEEGSPFRKSCLFCQTYYQDRPGTIPYHDGHFLTRQGFYARPVKAADGTQNMMVWELGIPGKQGVSSRFWTTRIKARTDESDKLGRRSIQGSSDFPRRYAALSLTGLC
jgi:hypothetical protein